MSEEHMTTSCGTLAMSQICQNAIKNYDRMQKIKCKNLNKKIKSE